MDVREKLVEIMEDLGCNDEYCKDCEFCNDIDGCVHRQKEIIADRLIANGVTVQEWISVEDRLPERRDVVLCFLKFGEQRILQWDNVSSWWLGYGHGDDWQKADVTNWMPLPEPPEREKTEE